MSVSESIRKRTSICVTYTYRLSSKSFCELCFVKKTLLSYHILFPLYRFSHFLIGRYIAPLL